MPSGIPNTWLVFKLLAEEGDGDRKLSAEMTKRLRFC